MTVTLKDVDDRDLWFVDIEPLPDARPARTLARHF
jgi:alkaline phosphatase D